MMGVRWRPWIFGALLLVCSYSTLRADNGIYLRAVREPGEATRVEVLLEVGGDLKLVDEGKVKPLAMSVVGKLRYNEKLVGSRSADDEAPRSLRQYERAEAVIKIEKETLSPMLRDERRLVVATAGADGTASNALYCPRGPLTRDELDLLDVPGNSLLIDQLLPEGRVSVGDQWQHSDRLLAGLLGLDAVSQSEVKSELKAIDAETATIELNGKVFGAVGGVASEIELAGKYRFDRGVRRVTRLALSIKENRSVGHVAAGLDVVAKLQVHVTPIGENAELADEALGGLPLDADVDTDTGLTQLEYRQAAGKYRIVYDRRWHIMSEHDDVLALRLVDHGDLIAQCNLTTLADVEPRKQPTLARFQQDVERTLGKDFGRFAQASQAVNEAGYAHYRVEVDGVVAGLPIRWNYHLLADDQGHLAVFVCTVEGELIEQLGDADQEIVSTLRFMTEPNDRNDKPENPTSKPDNPIRRPTLEDEKSARKPQPLRQ